MITIDEAIIHLDSIRKCLEPNTSHVLLEGGKLRDSVKLGIGALEEVKYYRNNPQSYVLKLLLGETEE